MVRKNQLDDVLLCMMAYDVCSALDHIASKGYIHRDVAARNVLVTMDRVCKLADFGLSRPLFAETSDAQQESLESEFSAYYAQPGGMVPVRWAAPEVLTSRKVGARVSV